MTRTARAAAPERDGQLGPSRRSRGVRRRAFWPRPDPIYTAGVESPCRGRPRSAPREITKQGEGMTDTDRIAAGGLQVDKKLYDFINDEALPGTGVSQEAFWSGFDRLVHGLAPRNRQLLDKREELQRRIDAWYRENHDESIDLPEYKAMLQEIGYLVPEGEDFSATTAKVDPEISTVAGPQLVVPLTIARYALNAANARWGSLYDALYGTDSIPEDGGCERTADYNPVRGDRVIAWARDFLDRVTPLAAGSHAAATQYAVADGALAVTLQDGSTTGFGRSVEVRRLPRRRGRAVGGAARQQRPAHRDPRRPRTPRRQGGRRRRARHRPGSGHDDDHGPRGRGVDGGRRGQGARLPELAGPGQGRPDRPVREGRPHGGPRHEPGARVHRAGRLDRDPAGDQSDADPQRRAPDDEPRHPRQGRQRGAGGDPRRADLVDDRGPRHQERQEQPRGLDLHRQAEDARAGGGRLLRSDAGAGGRHPRPRPLHHQDRHHGRGAADDGEPEGVRARREGAGVLHQHRLPRPHRRRDAHRDGSRADDPQEGDEDRRLDGHLRGLERRHRPGRPACRGTPRSARACGRCPT